MSKNILGIDVSKQTLSCALLSADQCNHKDFSNNKSGHKKIHDWLVKSGLDKIEIYLEATGSYGEEISEYLHNQGYIVKVVNPLRISSYAKTNLARHKTDKTDAKLIAEFGSKFDNTQYKPAPEYRKELRDLFRCSLSIKRQITLCSNHLENEHLLPNDVRKTWKKAREGFEKSLKRLRDRMIKIIEENKDLKEDFDNLQTIKAIGIESAIAILAELVHFEDFASARQLAAFVGVTPKHKTSGTSINGKPRISKMGVGKLRTALYLPSITAMRYNEYFKKFAEKLDKLKKAKKAIICAVMRKMVHVIYGIMKNKEKFDMDRLMQARGKSVASAQPVIAL